MSIFYRLIIEQIKTKEFWKSFFLTWVFISVVLLSILLLSGCKSAAQRHLALAKKHLLLAEAAGVKVDSFKTIVHDTITIPAFVDREKYITKVDTMKLKEICPEVKTPAKRIMLQKVVCPDVAKDTIYKFALNVDGHKFEIPVHVVASSIAGNAQLSVELKNVKVPFKKEVVTANIQPGEKDIRWYQLILPGIFLLIIGFVLGKVLKVGI